MSEFYNDFFFYLRKMLENLIKNSILFRLQNIFQEITQKIDYSRLTTVLLNTKHEYREKWLRMYNETLKKHTDTSIWAISFG